MKRRKAIPAGLTSGLLTLSLLFSSCTALPVFAEEEYYEENGEEILEVPADEAEEDVVIEVIGDIPPVFVITEFPDFIRDAEERFADPEIQEKYGKLTAKAGTPMEELKLPKKLKLKGYWEADGPDVLSEYEMLDMTWMMKSDYGEYYSEESPAGEYTFVPNYDDYCWMSDDVDAIRTEDYVDDLELTVTVLPEEPQTEEPQTEEPQTEEPMTEEPMTEGPLPEEPSPEDQMPEEIFAEDDNGGFAMDPGDYLPEDPAELTSAELPGYEFPEEGGEPAYDEVTDNSGMPEDAAIDASASGESQDDGYADNSQPADGAMITEDGSMIEVVTDDPSEDEDIFAGLDDSLIENGSTEIYTDSGNEIEIIDDANTQPEAAPEDPQPEPVPEEPQPEPASEEPQSEPSSEEPQPAPEDDAGIIVVHSQEPGVTFQIENSNSDVLSDPVSLDLNSDNVAEIKLINIGCSVDLTPDTVRAYDSSWQGYSVTLEAGKTLADSPVNATVTINDAEYKLTITTEKKAHVMNPAACTSPSKCANCEYTEGEALGHASADNATCTAPATCARCGIALEGTILGHASANNATCTTPATCARCGAALEGTILGHTWVEATCTAPKTCTRCGAVEGAPLGHQPGNNATCVNNATCTRCNAEVPGTALGHNWSPATCTVPKTCARCKAAEGSALGHSFGEWETTENSTDSKHGVQERYCQRDYCDAYESRKLNIIADPSHNAIVDLTEGGNYEPGARLTFTAVGAGMNNADPINGDVRYVPSAWSIQGTAGSWLNNYSGAFSISKSGTYTLNVTYQKQIYNKGWTSTDIADSRTVTFTIGGASADGSEDAVRVIPKTGDDTPIIPIVIVMAAALAVIIGMLIYRKRNK